MNARGASARRLGLDGEARAERFLTQLGYRLLERSFRSRLGEVDLIMQDGETVVFVEVKARSGAVFGAPEEAVTKSKQEKIAKAAVYYLARKNLRDVPVRFDVVSILGDDIRHFPGAFDAPGYTR